MICIRRKRGDREFLFLGLTDSNLERLKKGQPIRVSAETHRNAIPTGWSIGIVYGENMEELRLTLEKARIILPEE